MDMIIVIMISALLGYFSYCLVKDKPPVVNQDDKDAIEPKEKFNATIEGDDDDRDPSKLFRIITVGGIKTLFIQGQFTFRNHDDFFDSLVARIKQNLHKQFNIDLSYCDFIDSAGLGMLVIAHDEARKRNIDLVIKNAKGKVRDLLFTARFDTLYTIE